MTQTDDVPVVNVQHYKNCNCLFAKDVPIRAVFNDDPGVIPATELAFYIAGCEHGIHLMLSIGNTPERNGREFMEHVLMCRPEVVIWEFGSDDGQTEIERVLASLESVASVGATFTDGKLTVERLDLLVPIARRRYSLGLEFGAFNIPPPCFRDLVEALQQQTDRFKTALVCTAAARAWVTEPRRRRGGSDSPRQV